MRPIPENPTLGVPGPGPHIDFLTNLVQRLFQVLQAIAFRLNNVLPKDGSEVMGGGLPLATYTTATRPTVTDPALIYVSDAAAGQRFQGWDVTAGAWVPLG